MEDGQMLSSRPPTCHSAPWLIFFHGNKGRKQKSQTFFSLSEQRMYIRSFRKLHMNRCWPTPQGWMLLQDRISQRLSLLNLGTLKEIELPPFEWNLPDLCKCVLSLPATDPDCMVMCADFDDKCLFFCRPKDNNWIRHEYDLGENNIDYPLAYKGKFYARTHFNLAVIDFAPSPQIRILEHIEVCVPIGLFAYDTHLVESCGEMFSVSMFYQGTCYLKYVHISVAKRDFSKQRWNTVDSIGDRVFFLGTKTSAASWSASEIGVKGSCIYFIMRNDTRMYVFDMEEGTISVHLPCPNVRRNWSAPFWLMPAS